MYALFLHCVTCVDSVRVSQTLKDNPDFNINWKGNTSGNTLLHTASGAGYTSVMKVLLKHPQIDVNVCNHSGQTPIALTCGEERMTSFEILLNDDRTDISIADQVGRTPLWFAVKNNQKMVKMLLASGKYVGNIATMNSLFYGKKCTIFELARKCSSVNTEPLLRRFTDNPTRTRHELRSKLGAKDAMVSNTFALTIFLCDGLLEIKNEAILGSREKKTKTFFEIIRQLPMELQMILCNYTQDNFEDGISQENAELSFKHLAYQLSAQK